MRMHLVHECACTSRWTADAWQDSNATGHSHR